MKRLVEESPLLLLPTLAAKLGLNEAIVLQQLHFKLQQSPFKYGEYTWYHHTYTKWQNQFPFWSEKTISRVFLRLETDGIIVSTQEYNALKVNKTKWYRIDYDVLHAVLEDQLVFSRHAERPQPIQQIVGNVPDEPAPSELKELKKESIKKHNVDLVTEIIRYLNQKTNKEFRISNKASNRLINGRLREGYKLEDFKKVIDRKVSQWLTNPDMKAYLRPSTLFSPSNFENYLNETTPTQQRPSHTSYKPIVLDYSAGEEDY